MNRDRPRHQKQNGNNRKKVIKENRSEIEKINSLIRFEFVESQKPYNYVNAKNQREKTKIAERQSTILNPKAQLIAGDMFIDLSANAKEYSIQADNLTLAYQSWQKVLKMSDSLNPSALRAATQIAHLNSYKELILDNSPPDKNNLFNTFKQSVELAKNASQEFKFEYSLSTSDKNYIAGTISELNIICLLHRFNLSNQPLEWTVLPSLITEYNKPLNQPDNTRSSWDVSIFSHYGEAPDLIYKIQSKTSDKHLESYTDDISVIYLSHLSDDDKPLFNSRDSISSLLSSEIEYGDTLATKKLDSITNNLLELLDQ